MLKLQHQFFGHLIERTDSLEKTLMLGKIEKGMTEDGWLDGITNLTDMSLSKLGVGDGQGNTLQSMGLQRVGHDWVTELNR